MGERIAQELGARSVEQNRIARRGYLNPQLVTNLVEKHLAGAQDSADHVFALMMFELWHQEYIDDWPRRRAAVFRDT